MSRKIPVKVIMLYRDQGLSRNMIAKSQNVSRNSVSQVFQRASHLNISYQDIESMSDIEVYRYFFPEWLLHSNRATSAEIRATQCMK